MLLSARMLNNVASVNAFSWTDEVEFTQGDATDIYFQLIDATLDKPVYGFKPGGRRYMPAAAATLSVTINNIDDAVAITRIAVQPFAQDPSIWRVSVLNSDKIVGTCALMLALNETGKLTTGILQSAVLIHSPGNC
jgi:hypothetical protein